MTNEACQCLQFYSFGRAYLLPNRLIESIVPWQTMDPMQSHPWHFGTIDHQEQSIPLINLSFQEDHIEQHRLSNIIILRTPSFSSCSLIATVCEQIPRTLSVEEGDLRWVREEHLTHPLVRSKRIEAYIPDFELIEAQLSALTDSP